MVKNLILSIHTLVDFVLRTGDIDSRVFNNASMSEGTRIHMRYQSIQDGNYLKEVPLSGMLFVDDYNVKLIGRADGIIINGERVIIDEIKSCVVDLNDFYKEHGSWHLGQAICYAYLYALENQQNEMEIRLTYISQKDDKRMFKRFVYSIQELKTSVMFYIEEYLKLYKRIEQHILLRNISAENFTFPYGEYRKGQKEVAKYVYSVAREGGTLFFEAPTGIGKTISTLFPLVKAFPLHEIEKVFYLSAKNQSKEVALNACRLMRDKGLDIKTVLISSKESMCQCEARMCNPDECIFAKGYYSKLKDALGELLDLNKPLTSEDIVIYGKANDMCPFELQLDYSTLCDIIICDYNYVFDPLVYLKRYFEEKAPNYFVLVDEAHNLAERSLEMYSASLIKNDFVLLKKLFKRNRHPKFKNALNKLIKKFDAYISEDDYTLLEDDFLDDIIPTLDNYFKKSQDVLKNYEFYVSNLFIDCFREVNRFIKISEFYGENYQIYFDKNQGMFILKCLDASAFLNKSIKQLKGGVFFSATLTPLPYFIKRLGGENNAPRLKLESPFDKKRFLLLVRGDVSTLYKNRSSSYAKIVSSIKAFIANKIGNYLVFFPSYQYLNEVLKLLMQENLHVNIISQTMNMGKKEKDIFLNQFHENPSTTTLGFAVLGGSFSEGIDLPHDRLIGAIIIGVGLPLVCLERNLIKEYYNKHDENGFDYAYTNPGMNKVMQAAGRVIRTKDDVGTVLLIDQRFLTNKYQTLFKAEWSHYIDVYSDEEIIHYTKKFWGEF